MIYESNNKAAKNALRLYSLAAMLVKDSTPYWLELTQELMQRHLLRASDGRQPKMTESDELSACFIGCVVLSKHRHQLMYYYY